MITISPMQPNEEGLLHVLAAESGRPLHPRGWFIANPTLCAYDETALVGYTSYTIVLLPGHGQTLYGQDVCVAKGHRGEGIGTRLHKERLLFAKMVGVKYFMGSSHKDNKWMADILEAAGAHKCLLIDENWLFVGPTGA